MWRQGRHAVQRKKTPQQHGHVSPQLGQLHREPLDLVAVEVQLLELAQLAHRGRELEQGVVADVEGDEVAALEEVLGKDTFRDLSLNLTRTVLDTEWGMRTVAFATFVSSSALR